MFLPIAGVLRLMCACVQTGMSPGSDGMYAVGSGLRNDPLETHLLHHSRLRRLGPLDEEQVEVGPLLGRGSFGRVYKGAPSPLPEHPPFVCPNNPCTTNILFIPSLERMCARVFTEKPSVETSHKVQFSVVQALA